MSVNIEKLTKTYGAQKVLDDISFLAKKGEITGFLGTNGAGKSTTMKILAGYVGFNGGKVSINGIDVTKNSNQIKKITGYLPEHNPLYVNMYVKEYLYFVASAYHIFHKKKRIDEMIELCGLSDEQHKKIYMLSKGYRQRLGLAQTFIHDPDVLILDEPTSGLDPNQLIEIRKVIKTMSRDKTVIFSTHIMQEVEALCHQVVIINKGKIVANDHIKILRSSDVQKSVYVVKFEKKIDENLFSQQGMEICYESNFTYKIFYEGDPKMLIMKVIGQHDLPFVSISKNEDNMESIFQKLTNQS